jgi:outer membrane murein-binding lipoprotein Lpp
MSDAAADEPILTTEDGVTVEKTYEPEDFPVPAIAFTITSERDEAISVRLADTVPDDIPTEDIGFHPNYGAEFWEIEGSTIVFTREFEPHGEYVTVYGLRGKDAAEVDRFLTEPELTSVDSIQGASGNVVRDVIGAEASTADAPTDDAVDVTTPEPQPDLDDVSDGDLDIDLPDPAADEDSDETGEDGDTADADAGTDSGESGVGAVESDETSQAAALAAEIRGEAVDDSDLADLRDALGATAGDSTDARVDHLQSTVTDLEAYTDALAEFLDEEGDAQSILSEVSEEYESATERLDDLEREVARIDDLERDVARIDDLERDVGTLRADVTALDEDVAEATEKRLVEMEAAIESLEEELADVAEMRDRLAAALGGMGGAARGEDAGGDSDDADALHDSDHVDAGHDSDHEDAADDHKDDGDADDETCDVAAGDDSDSADAGYDSDHVDAGDDHTDDRDAVDESDDAGAEDDHTDDADADDESDDAGLDIDDVDADDDSDDADAEDEDVSDGPEINPED